jgi:hypothetical protein
MKIKSALVTQMSGSIGGLTGYASRGGLILRARGIPSGGPTVWQQAVRSYMGVLSTAWAVLTPANRALWDAYGASVGLVDALGNTIYVPGRQHYIRSNLPRLQAGLSIIPAGPSNLSLPSLSPVAGSMTSATNVHAVTFNNADLWATAVGGALLLYYSEPQSVTVNSFSGPYRYGGKIAGAASPPTSPGSITMPFPFGVSVRVFFKAEAVTAEGRLSNSFRGFGTGV